MLMSYTFQIVALGSIALGILTGLTGTFAVLKKQSLLGDSIAHAALAGITLSFILTNTKSTEVLLLGALVIGLIATWLINFVAKHSRIHFESAMALIMSVFFGLGFIFLTHIQKNPDSQQAGLERFLFGQAATILERDVWMVVGVTVFVIVLILLMWKELKVYTFDPVYTHSLGLSTDFLNTMISAFIVASIIMGIQMVGVVLMSALLIAPAVAARQWTKSLGAMAILSSIIGAVSGLSGTIMSTMIDQFPTGPAIVVVASVIVIVSLMFAPGRGFIHKLIRKQKVKNNFEADMAIINLVSHRLLDIDAEFTKKQLQEACIIDHHREDKAFESLFSNLLKRDMIVGAKNKAMYELTDEAKRVYGLEGSDVA